MQSGIAIGYRNKLRDTRNKLQGKMFTLCFWKIKIILAFMVKSVNFSNTITELFP